MNDYKSSAYYYWYAFLKEAKRQEPKHKIWNTFGDVSSLDFMPWWNDIGEEIFADSYGLLQGAEIVNDEPQLKRALKSGNLIISIDQRCTPDWINHCLGQILTEKGLVNKSGAGSHSLGKNYKLTGKYAFCKVPDVNMLERFLLAYQYSEQGLKPKEVNYILKEKHEIVVCDPPSPDNARKSIWQYKKNAENIISGVLRGTFPDY